MATREERAEKLKKCDEIYEQVCQLPEDWDFPEPNFVLTRKEYQRYRIDILMRVPKCKEFQDEVKAYLDKKNVNDKEEIFLPHELEVLRKKNGENLKLANEILEKHKSLESPTLYDSNEFMKENLKINDDWIAEFREDIRRHQNRLSFALSKRAFKLDKYLHYRPAILDYLESIQLRCKEKDDEESDSIDFCLFRACECAQHLSDLYDSLEFAKVEEDRRKRDIAFATKFIAELEHLKKFDQLPEPLRSWTFPKPEDLFKQQP
jgi:hypothetical protein